jgi:tetratricopeptide (TPR) repeat protein
MATIVDWFNLGIHHLQQRRFAEAAGCFQQVVNLDPSQVEGHISLGNAMMFQGRFVEAAACYRQALALEPLHSHAYVNLGSALMNLDLFADAVASFREALRINPQHAPGYNSLGKALLSRGLNDEAEACFRQATRFDPSNAYPFLNLGHALKAQQKTPEALAAYRQALQRNPNLAEACIHLAHTHWDLGQIEEAIAWYQRGLKIDGGIPFANYSLANALGELGRLAEAVPYYRRELEINPNHIDTLGNLASALMRLGSLPEAYQFNELVLKQVPTEGKGLFRRALLRLLHGDFVNGWLDYEHRFAAGVAPPRIREPRWDGSELNGKTILVCNEQGFGDAVQIARFLPLLKERGGTVLFEVDTTLATVLTGIPGVDRLVPTGGPYPPFDCCIPMMSLPGIFQTRLENIPAPVPYLSADPALVSRWQKEFESLQGLRVGIAWQGNPSFGGDRFRSIPLKYFESVARVPGIALISLQKGPGLDQLADFQKHHRITSLNQRLTNFSETAAVLMNLDLVISADTAVAHLAGALGLPVWVPLPVVPDWRWLLQRDDSPWYPTARLFRQTKLDAWDEVFERIARELQKRLDVRR